MKEAACSGFCTRFCWVPSWNRTLIIDIHSFMKKYKSSQNFVNVTLDLAPHPATVTTRTVTFLARDPNKHPHLPLLQGEG